MEMMAIMLTMLTMMMTNAQLLYELHRLDANILNFFIILHQLLFIHRLFLNELIENFSKILS